MRKFLLVSQTNAHFAKPTSTTEPHVVSMCMGAIKDGNLMLRVTIKSDAQETSEAAKNGVVAYLNELLTGRYKTD